MSFFIIGYSCGISDPWRMYISQILDITRPVSVSWNATSFVTSEFRVPSERLILDVPLKICLESAKLKWNSNTIPRDFLKRQSWPCIQTSHKHAGRQWFWIVLTTLEIFLDTRYFYLHSLHYWQPGSGSPPLMCVSESVWTENDYALPYLLTIFSRQLMAIAIRWLIWDRFDLWLYFTCT